MDLSQADKNYRLIGDVPLEAVLPLMRAKGSPMVASAAATHEAAKPLSALWWAQTGFENQWATTSKIIRPEDHNPAALRPWTEDPTATRTGDVLAWDTRAKVGAMKVPPYATGAIRASDGSFMLRFPDDAACAREWKRRMTDPAYKNGVYTGARTLAEMLAIYAPAGDTHPVTGVDNADANYLATVMSLLRRFAEAAANLPTHPDTPQEPPMPDKPYILITAGHRSTTDPGNPVEKDLTDDLALAYVTAFRAAGFTADWFQRDLDRDSNPTQTIGDLSTVATGCRNVLLSRKEAMSILLDLHFDGSESSVHCVAPDVTGLRSGYADGAPGNDTLANNALDRAVGSAIAGGISEALPGIGLYGGSGTPKTAGVMSERSTYVASDDQGNWRLGMFGGTAVVRDRAVRLVIEHAGTNAFRRYDRFAEKAAAAAVKAVLTVFNLTAGEAPKPEPQLPASPFKVGDVVRTKVELNIRREWNTNAKTQDGQDNVVATLPVGTIGTIIAGPNVNNGYRWWDLRVPGKPVEGTGHVAEGEGEHLYLDLVDATVPQEPQEPSEPPPPARDAILTVYVDGSIVWHKQEGDVSILGAG